MVKSNNEKVLVIGGGLAGLASACTLAARGYKVELFEKNDWLGGKAAILQKDGYRFDMGPTILTIPSVLARIFSEASRKMEDYIPMVKLEPQWRSFFDDGSILDLVSDEKTMQENLGKFGPNCASGYKKFLQYSERLNRISQRFFFWKSIGGLRDMFDWRTMFQPGSLTDVLAINMGKSVAQCVRGFVPEHRVSQMIDHFTQYVGSSPYQSPAVLCSIAHMQTSEGIWYPLGGTNAVPRGLKKLGEELGVVFHTGKGVKRIINDGKKVLGIVLENGEEVLGAAVVSNCDTVRTHRELIPDTRAAYKFEGRRKYEPACSGVVLYLGLDKRYEQLEHHDFVFSKDPEEEFDWIYNKGEPAPDPSCYVCAPAKTDPSVAPNGCESLYILVHTPYLRKHHDWSKMFPAYRKVILEKMERTAGLKDLQKHIRFEAALTPQDINDRYHVLNGAIYGLASHGKVLGAFKPSNRSPDLKSLYFSGGSAHPGPGMPMVLMSGWIAADTLDKDGIAPSNGEKHGNKQALAHSNS